MREVREYEEERKRRGRGAEGPGIYTSGSGSEVIWRVGACAGSPQKIRKFWIRPVRARDHSLSILC